MEDVGPMEENHLKRGGAVRDAYLCHQVTILGPALTPMTLTR